MRWRLKTVTPLPLISELMDKLRGAKYFSKLDVWWGYNNVCIKSGDEWKSKCSELTEGCSNPWLCSLGLLTHQRPFQWMMNDIFKDLIASGAVTVYLDDILIMSKTKEEHRQITCEVLKVLQKNKLFLKAEKCQFETVRDGVPRSHHQQRQHLYGSSQNRRISSMAHASQESAVTVILRLHQFSTDVSLKDTARSSNLWHSWQETIHGNGEKRNRRPSKS